MPCARRPWRLNRALHRRAPTRCGRSSCGAPMRPPTPCVQPPRRCDSSSAKRIGSAPASCVRGNGSRISRALSIRWACHRGLPRCLTSNPPSRRRRIRRSAPPGCGSSCREPGVASCVSTTSSMSGSTRFARRRRQPNCCSTTTARSAAGRSPSPPTTTAQGACGALASNWGRMTLLSLRGATRAAVSVSHRVISIRRSSPR